MTQFSLEAYRVPIDSPNLKGAMKELLGLTQSVEGVMTMLGWEQPPDFLEPGLKNQKKASDLVKMLKESSKRVDLKNRRIKAGFEKLTTPRKGLWGWFQKTFRDKKEQALPDGYEVIDWLNNSPRFLLLVAIHDALLSRVMTAEPRLIEMDELMSLPNPVGEMIATRDMKRADRIVKLLSSPMGNLDLDVLIHDISGYVVRYDEKQSVAYYYS